MDDVKKDTSTPLQLQIVRSQEAFVIDSAKKLVRNLEEKHGKPNEEGDALLEELTSRCSQLAENKRLLAQQATEKAEDAPNTPTPPPGELVFEYKRTTATSNNQFLEFEVRRLEAGKHAPASFDGDKRIWFEAHLTARESCFYQGDTLAEAIAALLLGSALLSREGSMNPNSPTEKGAPILQHVMEILQERQAWHLGLRKSWIHSEFNTPGEKPLELEKDDLKPFLRHSEAIGAISTALAALARVKDL